MRVLLISAYELGHQPLHVASPAGALTREGHDVRVMDLAVQSFDPDQVRWAEAVAISVPMHTAMRLAGEIVRRIRSVVPRTSIAVYGLYAGMNEELAVDAVFVGEYEPELLAWIGRAKPTTGVKVNLRPGRFSVPRRDLLPGLSSYSHLRIGDEHRLAGYIEASHGCRHRCRHCPLPVVYDGRYRIVDPDVVVADALAQVERGAQHITFGDPDFLNGPAHAFAVLERVHEASPAVTFDVTVKVEHLLRHRDQLARLAELGVLFVISAFESTDDRTLEVLDKGHTVADMAEVVELCRAAGLDIHPSWMPFVPWATPHDIVDVFRFLDRHELLEVTDPVQMSIRLLVPPGSLMLDVPEIRSALGPLDREALTYRWTSADPAVDELQRDLAMLAERGAAADESPIQTLIRQWATALEAAGGDPGEAQIPMGATTGRPRMTEPWFC